MSAQIAIVGRGCVLPGALDPASLWRLVIEGRDALGPVPDERWRLSRARALSREAMPDRAISDRGGYVRGFDAVFDPTGFAIEAESIAALDPIFRWTLHASREALREARVELRHRRAGVVLGNLSFPTASHAALVEQHWLARHESLARVDAIDPRERFHSSRVATLTARALALSGAPSFCLDAACASSLYAIALACDALTDGRADLMIAGAVNCTDDLFIHVGFTALEALSKSGQSRPFHPDADGLVPAEGAAVVALMRLDDALREGRPVLGVIRGVGLANDGRARSFLAPSETGQARAMRSAYAKAGVSPHEIGWIECHATGTPLGDATEVRSTARVFEGCGDVPIGSLKANLGHSITTAGAAGLLRILAMFEAGVRPPTPHLDRITDALAQTPLRVLTEAEPWEGPGRKAALSAFGFGGNDAHLIVEAHQPADATAFPPRPSGGSVRTGLGSIAIVGIGVRVGPFASAEAFADALLLGAGGRRTDEVELPLEALRTPPADLASALGQQTLLLSAALDARVEGLDPDRTGVLIGMECDSEIARYGVRWRLPELFERAGLDPMAAVAARDAFAPPLGAAGVLGTMPNVPANRLSRELDLRGPSYTVSAGELSGIRALEIATRALRAGELDHAIVGAVDLACEPVHEAVAKHVLPPSLQRGGDAAVVLVLERLDDARAKGRAVLAILDGDASSDRGVLHLGPRVESGSLAPRFGHAMAASGLVHVAAAALCLHRRARPGQREWIHDGARRAIVEVEALDGDRATVALVEDPATPVNAIALRPPAPRHSLVLRAHPPTPRLELHDDAMPPAPPLPVAMAEVLVRPETQDDREIVLEPAPSLAPRDESQDSLTRRERPHAALAPRDESQDALTRAPVRIGPAAPALEPVVGVPPTSASSGPRAALLAEVAASQRRIAELHAEFLRTQSELHERFVASRADALALLTRARPAGSTEDRSRTDARGDENSVRRESAPARLANPAAPAPVSSAKPPEKQAVPASASSTGAPARSAAPAPPKRTTRRGLAPNTPPPAPRGRAFTRAELEVHASGTISSIFGDLFAPQDAHAVQVRMPEPPLLLADRVMGLVGEAASMGKGSVWTETDVTTDAWYLANGRMPAGLMIESGQADLFLISWLGADLVNRGDRRYRLLGCTLTWHRSPPKVGETLSYDIHVDGHANQGDVRLFFFHYDCHIDGKPALTVRSGQAGFFTTEELAASAGVLWSPEDQEVAPDARVDAPAVHCTRRSFESDALEALTRGDVSACFGEGYERTRAHVRTPTISGGNMRFLERVTDFDAKGGPHGRGYLQAVTRIAPTDWYFAGHFKNDPCMPGTLMLEGCLSAMAFHMIGLGYTLDRDGWRFEPIPDETYTMICRGQVIPSSKELVYEVFVEEVHDGPIPKLYADLLCTVDGRKAFHARRIGLQLVPDWPGTCASSIDIESNEPVAELDGVRLDERALLASAWGRPSDAFGPRYREFDGARRAARLPGPPYHMVSRVTRVEGEPWSKKAGACVEIAYDVPEDAWYFADGASGAMPYALLLEAALQPCGWLASYVGSALGRSEDLRFRNLDGEGEVLADVTPRAGTLRTEAKLTSISDTASMVIVGFDVTTKMDRVDVFRLKTVFGFFPDAAFENQAGLPIDRAQRALFERRSERIDLRARRLEGLQHGRLALLDEVAFFDPEGGRAGLGAARAESAVDAGAWFFRAHFFQDPVQPGSLGMEAMLALLRFVMLEKGLGDGMRRPRFSPIARARRHRWKYRGQVLPRDRRIAVTLEVTSVERSEERIVAEAEASFWIDGKRIYEAIIAAELVDDGGASERRCVPGAAWPADGRVDADSVRRFWREFLGTGASSAEDLYLALLQRFVRRVEVLDRPALDALRGPAVYLANHQTAIETLMLSIIAGSASRVPLITLAKIEHRESWLGRLLAWFFAHPRVREPELTAYFDRNDPASLTALLRALPRDRSLLVHVEGTRALSSRHRIERISGVPIEHAIERGLPIVPVRFTGGLPVEPVTRKLDFPLAMGAQDLWIGAPLSPDELASLSYKARVERVRDAIEALGPRDNAPIAGDLAFAREVARWMEETGRDLPHAVLACALREADAPCALTTRMLRGEPLDDADPEERWAAALASRLR